MTRKWFLSLLGLGAAGQSLPDAKALPLYMVPNQVGPGGHPKPRNGECPVCGVMAPAYKRKMISSGFMTNCKPVQSRRTDGTMTWAGEVQCDEAKHWDGPATRTVSCTHCRVNFSQDAEDVK